MKMHVRCGGDAVFNSIILIISYNQLTVAGQSSTHNGNLITVSLISHCVASISVYVSI